MVEILGVILVCSIVGAYEGAAVSILVGVFVIELSAVIGVVVDAVEFDCTYIITTIY